MRVTVIAGRPDLAQAAIDDLHHFYSYPRPSPWTRNFDILGVYYPKGRTDLKNTYFYQINEKIYERGEAATYIYQVVIGAIRVFSKLNNGQRQIGSFFSRRHLRIRPGPRYRRSAEALLREQQSVG
jgi:hypothetical protein